MVYPINCIEFISNNFRQVEAYIHQRNNSGQHLFWKRLVTYLAASYHPQYCWLIVTQHINQQMPTCDNWQCAWRVTHEWRFYCNYFEMRRECNSYQSRYSLQCRALMNQYGPVTMIVPASGHQVRCIPWVQMGTFNKEIGVLCGLNFFAFNIFCGEYPQSSLHLMLQIWWKPLLWKMCQ